MSTKLLGKAIIALVAIGLLGIPACGKKELQPESAPHTKVGTIPTTVEELNLPEISDEKNAALVYREVFGLKESLVRKYKKEWDYMPYEGTVRWDKVPEEAKKKVIDLILHDPEFARMYELLEKASGMECVFFPKEEYQKNAKVIPAELLPVLSGLRGCARSLAEKAKIEAEYGDINKALSVSLTGLKLPKSLSNESLIISQLVRIALDMICLRTLEELADNKGGRIQLYQSIMKEIASERRENIVNCAMKRELVLFTLPLMTRTKELGEKAFELTEEEKKEIEELAKSLPQKTKEQLMKGREKEKEALKQAYQKSGCKTPAEFFEKQEVPFLEIASKMISLTQKPYWEVKEEFKVIEDAIDNLPDWQIYTRMILPGKSRIYLHETNLDGLMGTAEIAIANRIYKQKHGKYVDSLHQLTPEILHLLPLDPFTGKDYVYKKKDKGFIVYSLGENLRDDGGLRRKAREKDYDIVWECKS